jgi:hypothetical protein
LFVGVLAGAGKRSAERDDLVDSGAVDDLKSLAEAMPARGFVRGR